ncbi:MAG: hypothetical protein HC873_04540 [Leptolyngbyaceae cyanobacterium SL_1_1]|nr:hypothetical protein [Leptolyngbyaceae cyanobacterium RM1_1_2]NJO09042.1 hypothetical protein [Leptolyngbyaceae cyanobacterium SL_1_1]
MKKKFQQVEVTSRAQWRTWLSEHQAETDGIWLITFKKHCADKYVSYDAVVEEALCFGWIDSLPRKLDSDRTRLYISPRRKGSPWSRLNKQRVADLLEKGLIMPAGQQKIDQAKADGSWTVYDEVEDLIIPADLATVLEADPVAKTHFPALSDSAKKGILWWIKSAKQTATRQKRIA